MNIILLDQPEIQDNNVMLSGERAKHVVKVLQVMEGDWVRVGQVGGLLGQGQVISIQREYPFAVELRVQLKDQPTSFPRLDLLLALPRPIMLKRILSQVAALGIGRIFLIHSRRVEKSFWETTLFHKKGYTAYLRKGLEQAAVDTRIPEVCFYRKFKPFIEDIFPQWRDQYQHCILAHPSGMGSLAKILSGSAGRILFAIGPEGGWLDYEVEKFEEQGFYSCSLGERVLKVDTAVIALHAQISALCSIHD